MLQLFHDVSQQCSRAVAEKYSTSFYSAIRLLHKDMRAPICNIYGFVRLADEIVDSFHDYDKAFLLQQFKDATYEAIEKKISLNPILHSFQMTVNEHGIEPKLIESFFASMERDLSQTVYDDQSYNQYIYGSAETVGLMCLYIFTRKDSKLYDQLQNSARALGAGFQKVNFLRDLKSDNNSLNRMYFPGCDFGNFSEQSKKEIEADIEKDFAIAFRGILKLPADARFGVYVAYKYYFSLFSKIKRMRPKHVIEKRVRVADYHKAFILLRAGVKYQLKLF